MRKLFLIMMTLCAFAWSAVAQTRTYSGTVVDAANNEPLIGATVMPIGGGQGTATDIDGNFSLTLPANVKNVKVSYVGYKEQTVALHDKMTVKLASSSTNLQDVVVVAYGTANKESLTGSVAVVGAKEIEDRPVTNALNALEGAAPGVNVNSSTGYPGSSPQIRIRGFNSFDSGAQEPLYVVDGLVYNGSISSINPADIESMSVLKDAASCALYGSRGANGVVLITTKKAKGQGKVDVNVQMNWGAYGTALPLYDRLNADRWMEASLMGFAHGSMFGDPSLSYEDALAKNSSSIFAGTYLLGTNIYGMRNADGVWVPAENNEVFNAEGRIADGVAVLPGYTDLDWWKAITRTGSRQEYTMNAAGASEKFDIFASMGYLNQKGYVIETDYQRFSGRLNANFRPVSYFKAGMNLAATYSKGTTANVSASNLNTTVNPFQTQFYAPVRPMYVHDADGNIELDNEGNPVYNIGGLNAGGNIIQATRLNKINNTNLNVDASLYGTAVLPYGFEATVRGGMYRSRIIDVDYSNNQEGAQKGVGGLDQEYDRYYTYTFEQSLNWAHEYGANHVDVLLHHENFNTETQYAFYRASGQKVDNRYTVGNFDEVGVAIEGIYGYRTESYLGRARYNYDQKYFAEVSLNRDGSSQFAKDHRWGTFWSVGASWIISKEKFMQSATWLNYLKLRAAYGTVGNNQACSYYNYLTLFSFTGTGNLALDQLAAPELRWESTNSFDVAVEGSMFDDRFNFSVGFYDKRNADLIYSMVRPWSVGTTSSSGYNPSILTNIGEMQNYGFELQFGVDIIRNANLKWNFNLDASFNINKIKQLPNGRNISSQSLFIGKSLYENYTYEFAGVDQVNGRSLYAMNPDSPDFYAYAGQQGAYYWDRETNNYARDENGNLIPVPAGEYYYNGALYKNYLDAAKADGTFVEIDGVPYTYKTSHAGRKLMGSKLPVCYGSFGTSLNWKGINLGLLFTYSLGGKIYDSNYAAMMGISKSQAGAMHKDVLKGWTSMPENLQGIAVEDMTAAQRIDKHGTPQLNTETNVDNTATSSQYLVSADFLSLKNINLSYDLPSKWVQAMKLQGINVGFMMENAFIATARKGLNAQSAISGRQGSSGAYYQPARTYTFQLSVKF